MLDTAPHPLGDPRRHMMLVRAMARATGVDLVLAQARGVLPASDWVEAITRCRGCDHADACAKWLDTRYGEPADVPDHCANQELLLALGDMA